MKTLTKITALIVRTIEIVSLPYGFLTIVGFSFKDPKFLMFYVASVIAITLGIFSMLKWREKLPSENALRVQFLIATIELMISIISRDMAINETVPEFTNKNLGLWVIASVAALALSIFNILFLKGSGLRGTKSGAPIIVVGSISIVTVGLTALISYASSSALGKFLKMMLYSIWRVFLALTWPIRRLYLYLISLINEGGGISEGGLDPKEYVPEDIEFIEMTELEKKIWEIGALLFVIFIVFISIVGLIRYLKKKKFVKVIDGRSVKQKIDKKEKVAKRNLRKFLDKIKLELKIWSHPKSVAFALRKLEKKYRLSPKLRKKEWETTREFLQNISNSICTANDENGANPEALKKQGEILELIKRVDFETYSKDGNLLNKL